MFSHRSLKTNVSEQYNTPRPLFPAVAAFLSANPLPNTFSQSLGATNQSPEFYNQITRSQTIYLTVVLIFWSHLFYHACYTLIRLNLITLSLTTAKFKQLFGLIFAITFTCKSELRPTHFVLEYTLNLFLPTGDRLCAYTQNDTFSLSYLKTSTPSRGKEL